MRRQLDPRKRRAVRKRGGAERVYAVGNGKSGKRGMGKCVVADFLQAVGQSDVRQRRTHAKRALPDFCDAASEPDRLERAA